MNDFTPKPRKKPQFVHLHPTQAAKAKQAWVNKVKVRSQWAKEKRKVALVDNDQHEDMQVDTEHVEEPDKGIKDESEEKSGNAPAGGPSRKRKRPSRSEGGLFHTRPPTHLPSTKLDEKERRERLRDLSRKAYAPESLHTFKSHPLHRQRGGARLANVSGARRGQPNMKLRMNALLEKIKLDAGLS